MWVRFIVWLCATGVAYSVSKHQLGSSLSSVRGLRAQENEEAEALAWLDSLDREYSVQCNLQMVARWMYITNVTDESSAITTEANELYAKFQKDAWERVIEAFNSSSGQFANWESYEDKSLIRRIAKLKDSAKTAILTGDDLTNYLSLQAEMETIYAQATICNLNGTECGLALEPHITDIMSNSRDYDELTHVWAAWRNVSGKLIRDKYIQFYQLLNKAAQLNDYPDAGAMWVSPYDDEGFRAQIDAVWTEMEPFYKKLHAYVRRKLNDVYGDKVGLQDAIPAQLLGNPWAQQWGNIADLTIPYPNASSIDVTAALQQQNYDVQRIFKTSEEFFTSLGLQPMTQTFWDKSMFEKPEGREVVCHASAEDFCLGPGSDDFRIKMCTTINQNDFVTVHHEMGHIQYFQQYRDQPHIFRDGANPGFHEAIGDTLALSVATPAHLETIGLLTDYQPSDEADINYLLNMALDKIAFLPFAYIIDKWRWDIFSGVVQPEGINGHWWTLRETIQGLKAPVPRSEEDFDPGAKYHVPANVPYVRYFVSFIVQFQFYESLCKEAGKYDPEDPAKPLYKCDFYANLDAGRLMENALKVGYNQPWPETMQLLTGQKEMSASSLKTYFAPLEKFLDQVLENNQDCIGWGSDCTMPKV